MLTVARDDKTADVDGWVTLTNGSGTAFSNAKLQLVAGDLNRVRQVIGKMAHGAKRRRDLAAAAPPMSQEAFSDYHLYTLGRKTTHQQQRDQAGQHARRDARSRSASATSWTARPSTTATRSIRARR